jgi:hypothetical protein
MEVNRAKLCRALSKAFDFDIRKAELDIPNTFQFASYSTDAVPVILTIQTEQHFFRRAVAELVAMLNSPFILFAPTSDQIDARSQSLLTRVKAGFFPLASHVILTPHGTLLARTRPGDLFASFRPDPKYSVGEDVARQTMALAKALDAQYRFRKAPLYTVFLLYCSEGLTVEQIAKECDCGRSIVFMRLKLLHRKLGRHPAELRQYSAHFEKIEASLADPRARQIYRKGATYGEDGGQEAEE